MTRSKHIKRIIELLLIDPSTASVFEAFDDDIKAALNLELQIGLCSDGVVFDSSVADILMAYNNYWQTDITEDEVRKLMVLI